VEDVRKLRPTIEHAQVLGAIPDVVEGLKKYNIIVSTGMHRTFDNPAWYKDYGPAIDAFAMPAKTLLQQGVKLVGQGFNSNVGWRLWLFMSRNIDGKILLPSETIDRVTALKMLTPWAAYYVLKEQDLGTLEVGKLADFVVLDRDYFTIPQDDIPKIRPQLTFMGGKIRYLSSEYAAKLDDLRHNYALRVTVDWVQGLTLFTPVHRYDVLIKRRKGERIVHIDWHPAIRAIEPPPCDWGPASGRTRMVCDDHLHLTDPGGQAPCPSCGKAWCRACHAANCPRCGRAA